MREYADFLMSIQLLPLHFWQNCEGYIEKYV